MEAEEMTLRLEMKETAAKRFQELKEEEIRLALTMQQ
jgi:hypothetical protein